MHVNAIALTMNLRPELTRKTIQNIYETLENPSYLPTQSEAWQQAFTPLVSVDMIVVVLLNPNGMHWGNINIFHTCGGLSFVLA